VQAKQDAENLRAQLKEEKAKHKQAQQALVDEQQYFMDKLADMEAITKGEPCVRLLRCCLHSVLGVSITRSLASRS
jgi:hypothetical protein